MDDKMFFERIDRLKADFGQGNAARMLTVHGFAGWMMEFGNKLFSHRDYKGIHLLMNEDLRKKISTMAPT